MIWSTHPGAFGAIIFVILYFLGGNPARIKNVVSFSGGRTSAYLCYLMKQLFGDDVDFVFMDTGAEHPKTYEFIRKVNKEFNLNLVCLRVKINPILGQGNSYEVVSIDDICHDLKPFSDMMQKYGTPYFGGAFCTQMMKGKPYVSYCNDKYGKGNYESWVGIRIDEPTRLNDKKFRYLAEISDFEKQDVLDWWNAQGFNLDIPEPLGNCVFCVKKGNNKIAYATRLEPEYAKRFLDAVYSDSVRITDREKPFDVMYRSGNSLRSVIKMYEEFSTQEIEETIRSMKREETGSCSESCEANLEFDFGEDL